MKVEITFNNEFIRGLEKAALASAAETLEAVYTDLVSSQTMPFDTGDMQNNQTFVETSETGAVLITGSPQARRPIKDSSGNVKGFRYRKGAHLIPDPKGRMLNFQKGKNANAGAYWLEPYITGGKKDFAQAEFTEIFKRRAGL